jgi:inhibitor of KinA sporulation pathway (predicted exonuclease)
MTEVHAKIVEHFSRYVKISQSPSICHHIQSGRIQMAQVSESPHSEWEKTDRTLYFHLRYVKISQSPNAPHRSTPVTQNISDTFLRSKQNHSSITYPMVRSGLEPVG